MQDIKTTKSDGPNLDISPHSSGEIELNRGVIVSDKLDAFKAENPDLIIEGNKLPIDKLIEKGYVFYNSVGNGGRPIITKVGDKDYSKKLFLTKGELDEASAVNKLEGSTLEQVAHVGKRMHQFINDCVRVIPIINLFEPKVTLFSLDQGVDLAQHVWDNEIKTGLNKAINELERLSKPKRFVPKFFETKEQKVARELAVEFRQIKEQMISKPDIKEIVLKLRVKHKTNLPTHIGPIAIKNILSRKEGGNIVGKHSPILTDNHYFDSNNGVYIYDETGRLFGGSKKVRLNEVVAVLAEHGISNTEISGDPDQTYITFEQFFNNIYPFYEPLDEALIVSLTQLADKFETDVLLEAFNQIGVRPGVLIRQDIEDLRNLYGPIDAVLMKDLVLGIVRRRIES